MKRLAIFLAITAIGFMLYGNILDAPFQFDDYDFVVNNSAIKNPSTLLLMLSAPGRKTFAFLSFAFNYFVGGLNPFGYHLVNLMIHIINAFLLYISVSYILKTPRMRTLAMSKDKYSIPVFAALIFLAHPLQTESVTYIWQRSEVLCGFFYLSAYLLYLFGRVRARKALYLLSLIVFFIGIYAKESIISLPLLVALTEVSFFSTGSWQQKTRKKNKAFLILFSLTALLAAASIYKFWRIASASMNAPLKLESIKEYLLTQFGVIIYYIKLTFIPFGQNLDYAFKRSKGFMQPETFFSFLILALILIAACRLFKKERLMSFGIFFYFIYLLPTSSVLPLADVIFEHRLYLSIAGFGIFTGALLIKIDGAKKRLFLFLLILFAFSFLTISRNNVWRSQYALMADTVNKSPSNPRPKLVLASLYMSRNEYNHALPLLKDALAISPNYAEAHNNLGIIYYEEANYEDAFKEFSLALKNNPNLVDPYINIAVMYAQKGDLKSAEEWLDKGRGIPDHRFKDKLYLALGNIYMMRGLLDKALMFYSFAQIENPDNPNVYFNKGNILADKNRYEEAVASYKKAISKDDSFTDAYINAGITYFRMNDFEQALNYFRKALEISPERIEVKKYIEDAISKMSKRNKGPA